MIKKKVFFLTMIIFLVSGCEKITSPEGQFEGQFKVKVYSSFWQPVAGATIEGGIDWEYFQVQTDSRGIAVLPGFARGQAAIIYRNNFFPRHVQSLSHPIYFIKPTPKQFKLIGEIAGWSILFDSETLITVDYQGGYHVYSYNDYGITEIAFVQIPKCIRETQLHGDTLWFSTHDDGIYVYSLENPLNPQQLFHLDIPGYLGSFAIKDEIVVVGNPWDRDLLRVYSCNSSGDYQEIANFGNYLVRKMAFISDYLIVIDYYDNLPAVFDLQNPAEPYLVYNGVEPDFWSGFLYRNYLILIPLLELIEEITYYKLLDLSYPTNPLTTGYFSADSRLLEIINDTTAIGRYHSYSGAISVLSGDITRGFKTDAIITDDTFLQSFLHEFEGCTPPYFIIGKRLWKLEDWSFNE